MRQNVSPTVRGKELIAAIRNARSERGVRTSPIVVGYPLAEELSQEPLVEWDQVIQTFPAHRSHQPLAVAT